MAIALAATAAQAGAVGRKAIVAALGLFLALIGPARADLIFIGTGTDSDGSPISATVTFSLTGNIFQVVLTNNDVANSQASVLTNLGFNAVPAPATPLPSVDGTASRSTFNMEPAPARAASECLDARVVRIVGVVHRSQRACCFSALG